MANPTYQNPTYGNVKLKNNVTDNSATKVNVQSTDGTINTISKSDLVNVVEVNDVPSLPLVGEAGKIYVVKNINKIYRWNGTIYQELAVTDISGKINVSEKGVTVATLEGGKIPNSQIPALAISETFPVSSQAQMLALSQADQGDVAIRSDISKSFILRVSPSSVLANWSELLSPTDAVTSVAGKVGVVTLNTSDIGGLQTALNLKEPSFSKNTAFNKPFGTTAGTVVEGGTLGSNAYTSTAFLPLTGGDIMGNLTVNEGFGVGFRLLDGFKITREDGFTAFKYGNADEMRLSSGGLEVLGTVTATSFNGSATLTGTPTAPTASLGTNTTQIATTAFVLANGGRPYKTALLKVSQTGVNAPVSTVIQNDTQYNFASPTWGRTGAGDYRFFIGTVNSDKVIPSPLQSGDNFSANTIISSSIQGQYVQVVKRVSGTGTDDLNFFLEIRVYN